jgi:excisionase family DNA binding protein
MGRVLTAAEAAALLRVSAREVQRLAAAGRLPGAFKVGKLWRISEDRLMEGLVGSGERRGA